MSDGYINVTPKTNALVAMRRQNMTWQAMIGELIDNSLDAGATRVTITFGNRMLTVEDNGCGCLSLEQMVTVGEHGHRKTTRLGRYGVGLNDVAASLWARLVIRSYVRGSQMLGTYDVPSIAKSDTWLIPNPSISATDREGSGTVLTFYAVSQGSPGSLDQLADDLGFTFAPALRDGKQIEIVGSSNKRRAKKITCKPYEFPMLDDKVETEFSVNGKRVKLRAGIVKDGEVNNRNGFAIVHEHRVVKGGSAIGANGYSTSRISGQIELDRGWTLRKNKDDISDEAYDELAPEIAARCSELFERASLKARHLQVAGLSQKIEASIGSILESVRGKERRGKKGGKGTHGRGSGKKRKRTPSKIQDGDQIIEQISSGNIVIDWHDYGDSLLLGAAQTRPPRITFNQSHEFVAKMQREDNSSALVSLAIMLLLVEASDRGERELFPAFRHHDCLPEAFGECLSGISGDENVGRLGDGAA